jgi:hypothetical protein
LLQSLPVGTAWVWAPGWPTDGGIFQRVQIAPIETYDSGAAPKVGQKPQPPKTLADVDLGALKSLLASTVEQVQAEDPRALRKRVAELERLAADLARLSGELNQAARAIFHGVQMAKQQTRPPATPVPAITRVPREHRRPPPVALAPRPAPAVATARCRGPQQKILDVLATLERLGLAAAHRALVGAFSGYSYTSGNFQNLLGQLKSRSLIDYPSGGLVALTAAGREIAQPSGTFRTPEDLHPGLVRPACSRWAGTLN